MVGEGGLCSIGSTFADPHPNTNGGQAELTTHSDASILMHPFRTHHACVTHPATTLTAGASAGGPGDEGDGLAAARARLPAALPPRRRAQARGPHGGGGGPGAVSRVRAAGRHLRDRQRGRLHEPHARAAAGKSESSHVSFLNSPPCFSPADPRKRRGKPGSEKSRHEETPGGTWNL